MRLYLVRHAEAEVSEPKALTAQGREAAQRMAARLRAMGIRPQAIYHSGKLRARQTAEIVGQALGLSPQEAQGLAPLDDPAEWAQRLRSQEADVMLVGHIPHVGRLAALLLCGRDSLALGFGPATVAALERTQAGSWALCFMLPVELA
jgi:phosphohistidine phosphatase